MNKPVIQETIWEFSSQIKMMNFVFFMKKAIFKKTFLKMGNN